MTRCTLERPKSDVNITSLENGVWRNRRHALDPKLACVVCEDVVAKRPAIDFADSETQSDYLNNATCFSSIDSLRPRRPQKEES